MRESMPAGTACRCLIVTDCYNTSMFTFHGKDPAKEKRLVGRLMVSFIAAVGFAVAAGMTGGLMALPLFAAAAVGVFQLYRASKALDAVEYRIEEREALAGKAHLTAGSNMAPALVPHAPVYTQGIAASWKEREDARAAARASAAQEVS